MKQKYLTKISLGILCSLSLFSCRVEEPIRQNEDYKKFATFISKNGEMINYANGFKKLFEKHDLLYKTQNTKRAIMANQFSKSIPSDAEYIEFNIHSELVITDSEKIVVYPVIKNNSVIGLAMATLQKNETEIILESISTSSPNYSDIFNLFTTKYQEALANNSANKMKTGDIEEVIIIIVKPVVLALVPSSPIITPLDCEELKDCPDNGGGGGGSEGGEEGSNNLPYDPNSPCGKITSVVNKADVILKKDELYKQSKIYDGGKEKGVSIKHDGTTSPIIEGGSHYVNFPSSDYSNYNGGYHNHTLEGIKMLSPNDIGILINFANLQPNQKVGDAFFGMIVAEGNITHDYIITFTGTKSEAIQFYTNGWDYDGLKDWYMLEAFKLSKVSSNLNPSTSSLNSQGLEKLFYALLKKMGLENNIVQNITYDSDGNPTKTNCN